MFHSAGWQRVAATLISGGCVVTSPQPSTTVLESFSAMRITGCFLPTPVLRLLLRTSPDAMRTAMSTIRSLELGSTPIKAEELQSLCANLPDARIFFHYGLTECSRASILEVRRQSGKLTTVGTPAPGVDIRICDAEGDAVAAGETGQIVVRGPQQSSQYWNRPDLNREKFSDGWLLTDDYGSLDEDGFLTVAGRRDDMVTSAGYHFFPAEVETELGPVPGVVDYLVAGLSSRKGFVDQWLWAFVVPADPHTWRPNDFLAFARNRLPSHMMPRHVVPVPALPLTQSGKPDRARTVQLYAETDASGR
jgi:acyl-CoA synthetase (AMP-forming)/AMP-acid ligase II